jgi:hypothetical protein
MPTSNELTSEYNDITSAIWKEKAARNTLNSRWIELWSLYKTNPLRVANDEGWQSKLNDGRVFEIVETVASYIRNALFFSDNWVELSATEPGLGEMLPLVSTHFRNCLNASNLRREFSVYMRQLLLLGFSGMNVDYVDGKIVFTTINSYDLYIESNRRYDSNSFCFREVYLNESSFYEYLDEGLIDIGNENPEKYFEQQKTAFNTEQAQYQVLSDTDYTINEHVRLCEYWCPVEKTLYRLIDKECVAEEQLKECPWLISTIYELPDSAYGLGLMDSSIGLILENNCIMNSRLDNMRTSVDNMWLFVDDGVTNPDDIKTAPGKVINVSRPDVLTPLYPPHNNFQVTYQEASIIDQKIDRNTGTGALISSGQYRSGERVTAEEINAVKDAGGNRLTDIYEHVENTFILPLLKRALQLIKIHAKKSIVELPSEKPGVSNYYSVLPGDFTNNYNITISASQSVINRDRNIRRIQEFIGLVNSVPQFAQLVDFQNLYTDLLTKFGFDNPQRYLVKKQEEPEAAPAAPTSALQELTGRAEQIGGKTMQDAVTGLAASGELPQALQGLTQGAPSEVQDQALAQQQQLALTQPLAPPQA